MTSVSVELELLCSRVLMHGISVSLECIISWVVTTKFLTLKIRYNPTLDDERYTCDVKWKTFFDSLFFAVTLLGVIVL